MLIQTYEAAATLTVGVDAFRNERQRTSSKLRWLAGVAIVGANAVNECAFDVYIEDYYVGRFRNTASGVVNVTVPDDIVAVGPHAIPAGSAIAAIVQTAPSVNPVIIRAV
tara:strand:- start:1056 stop:1385 length:330 start_codon:yes stop_codon:yes gene_type:complete